MTSVSDQTAKVFGYIRGLHATHFLDVGVRLGLFARWPRAAPAQGWRTDLGCLSLTCARSARWGSTSEVLDREGESYHLAPEMDRLLARPDDPFYLGGFPRVHLTVGRDYARYPELFASGGVLYQEHDRAFLEDVAGATRMLPVLLLETLARACPAAGEADVGRPRAGRGLRSGPRWRSRAVPAAAARPGDRAGVGGDGARAGAGARAG
jgi:hypothetical protein